ncbi:MAG: hypothetical protein ACOYNC_18275 [Bacteroidales bacterium]
MPANLNALIRYKTINSCLYGGRRKWSIRELIEACSEALGESRGRYNLISERTVRDDLRVLKSDILGFNAPIEQEKGFYFYSDPQFSILTLKITDAGLADKIFTFLIHLRNDIQHPELESIIEQLCKLTNKTYERPVQTDDFNLNVSRDIALRVSSTHEDLSESLNLFDKISPSGKSRLSILKALSGYFSADEGTPSSGSSNIPIAEKVELSWGDVLAMILV